MAFLPGQQRKEAKFLSEPEEMLSLLRQDDSWGLMIDRLKVARNSAMKAAIAAAKASGLPERGSAFHTLVETCSLKRKPDQVLGAIHYLREVEGVSDSPPRVINQLFEDEFKYLQNIMA